LAKERLAVTIPSPVTDVILAILGPIWPRWRSDGSHREKISLDSNGSYLLIHVICMSLQQL